MAHLLYLFVLAYAGPLFVLWLLCSGPLFLLPALALWRLWRDYQMWRWRTGRRRGPMPLS